MEAGLVSDATEMASGYRFYRRRLQGFMVAKTSTTDTEHKREPQLTNSDLTRSLQGCRELGVWVGREEREADSVSSVCFPEPFPGWSWPRGKDGQAPWGWGGGSGGTVLPTLR